MGIRSSAEDGERMRPEPRFDHAQRIPASRAGDEPEGARNDGFDLLDPGIERYVLILHLMHQLELDEIAFVFRLPRAEIASALSAAYLATREALDSD